MQILIETIGWAGSLLILVSLAQSQPARLHLLNVIACLILIAYNGFIGAVPGVGLNVGLVLVNLWRLRVIAKQGPPVSVPDGSRPAASADATA